MKFEGNQIESYIPTSMDKCVSGFFIGVGFYVILALGVVESCLPCFFFIGIAVNMMVIVHQKFIFWVSD
jgi:hypothetical protein